MNKNMNKYKIATGSSVDCCFLFVCFLFFVIVVDFLKTAAYPQTAVTTDLMGLERRDLQRELRKQFNDQ